MKRGIWTSTVLAVVIATGISRDGVADAKGERPYTISKETTWVTEPLRPDGRPDYLGAYLDATSKGVTADNNAVVPIIELVSMEEFAKLEIDATETARMLGLKGSDAFRGAWVGLRQVFGKDDLPCDTLEKLENTPWSKDKYPQIETWLERNEPTFAGLHEASRRARYFIPWNRLGSDELPLNKAFCPIFPNIRNHMHLFQLSATQKAYERDWNGCRKDLNCLRSLSQRFAEGFALLDRLTSTIAENSANETTIGILQSLPVPKETLEQIAAELDGQPVPPRWASCYDRYMRLQFLEAIVACAEDGPECLTPLPGKDVEAIDLSRVDWEAALRHANQTLDELVQKMNGPIGDEQFLAVQKMEDRMREQYEAGFHATDSPKTNGESFADWLAWQYTHLPSSWCTSEANRMNLRRFARLACALYLFEEDNGRFPERLDVLVPKYLDAVPMDAFAGKPMGYRLTEDGCLYYSVGKDRTDDDGTPPDGSSLEGYDDMVELRLH